MNIFPKDKFRVRISRFIPHQGTYILRDKKNTSKEMTDYFGDSDMSGAVFTDELYAVRASLYDKSSKVPLVQVWSRCNKNDKPSRKEGVRIAMERLEKAALGMGLINPVEE